MTDEKKTQIREDSLVDVNKSLVNVGNQTKEPPANPSMIVDRIPASPPTPPASPDLSTPSSQTSGGGDSGGSGGGSGSED